MFVTKKVVPYGVFLQIRIEKENIKDLNFKNVGKVILENLLENIIIKNFKIIIRVYEENVEKEL